MTGNVINSLCDLALKAVQKAFNALSAANKQLTEKVKILSRKKADGPVFSVDVIKSDEKCKHYTGFPNYAVFVIMGLTFDNWIWHCLKELKSSCLRCSALASNKLQVIPLASSFTL